MNVRRVSLLVLLFVCVALVGCSPQVRDVAPGEAPDTSTGAEVGTGFVEIFITDDPPVLNIEKALITISGVRVHRATEEEASDEETEAGWLPVVETAQTFDLIELRDTKAFLGSAELEAGRYTQIRLTVEEALVTIDGTEHALKVPSGTIKLVHPFTVEAGQTTELTLDFDAEESIHAAGNKYMMRPTIKLVVEGPTS